MGAKPKYKVESKACIIQALQVMLDNLYVRLRICDTVSLEFDTEEEHRKLFEGNEDLLTPSQEELFESLEESKDRSIRELGHIEKRITEVRCLKEAFEGSEVPPLDVLSKTYGALRSSLIFEAMNLCSGNPRAEIFASGVAGLNLGKEKIEEIERLGNTMQVYSEALWFGFNLFPFRWSEFPFDDI